MRQRIAHEVAPGRRDLLRYAGYDCKMEIILAVMGAAFAALCVWIVVRTVEVPDF